MSIQTFIFQPPQIPKLPPNSYELALTYLYELQNLELSSSMATFTLSCFLALSLCFVFFIASAAHTCPPYLSPLTFSQNYQKMVTSFRVFMYIPPQPLITTPPASLLYDSLIDSPFLTQDPNQADLFFVPFSPDTSTRSLGRVVRELRIKYPYWNRTLGADHFFIAPTGIDFSSDRNVLELKKNSIQVSVFPTTSGYFIPHKDITLSNPSSSSSLALSRLSHAPPSSFLAYLKWDGNTESDFVNALRLDPDFLVESEPLDHAGRVNISSKFCLFFYHTDVAVMTEAMASGCVPAIIVDRPVQDFPLTDVLRWSEMALLVGSRRGPDGLTAVLRGVTEDRYQRMREFCVAAAHHMIWNAEPQPYDAFHMVMYQLWMRRHTIRYTRREEIES